MSDDHQTQVSEEQEKPNAQEMDATGELLQNEQDSSSEGIKSQEGKGSDPTEFVADEPDFGLEVSESETQEGDNTTEPVLDKQDSGSKAGGETKEKKGDGEFTQFLEELDALKTVEEKLGRLIDFMEASIAQSGSPNFRHFWESKKRCLPLFKESINPALRAHLWERYGELTGQARKLKELFDQETAFAVEQIDMAVKALEEELGVISDHLGSAYDIDLPKSDTLKAKYSFYNGLQKELGLLNAYASRINSLRKELIKTEMRVRQKNQFFSRLSQAGNQVFPRRKELIKEVSDAFVADVTAFIEQAPDDEKLQKDLHHYREEIKALQSTAKALTLNTRSFSNTRSKLSGLWDRIRNLDKAKKKQWAERREELKGNAVEIAKQIEEFSKAFVEGGMELKKAHEQLSEIQKTMRDTALARPEVQALKEQLARARGTVNEKADEAEQKRQAEHKEKDAKRRAELQGYQERLQKLIDDTDAIDVEAMVAEKDAVKEASRSLMRSKAEKQQFDRLFKAVKDVITDKKEQVLLQIPDDDRAALSQLQELLNQRQERRKEIKEQLEQLRRQSGSSGLDFDQAITVQEQINEEKGRLEKATAGIAEIEEKIKAFEKKVRG